MSWGPWSEYPVSSYSGLPWSHCFLNLDAYRKTRGQQGDHPSRCPVSLVQMCDSQGWELHCSSHNTFEFKKGENSKALEWTELSNLGTKDVFTGCLLIVSTASLLPDQQQAVPSMQFAHHHGTTQEKLAVPWGALFQLHFHLSTPHCSVLTPCYICEYFLASLFMTHFGNTVILLRGRITHTR